MNKMFKMSLATATVVFGLSGCVGQPEYTPEQIQQQNEMRALLMEKMKQSLGNFGQNVQTQEQAPAKVETPAISQADLKSKVDSFGIASAPVKIEKTKSGFSINGKPYSDYEGAIKQVNYNNVNGFITYVIQTSTDNYAMKFMQATSDQEALTVATVKFSDGTWYVNSVTGKKLSGDTLILGSSGFAITRADGSGFTYEHAKGIKSINIPEGYQVAKFQNGDILGSKNILIEIPEAKEDENGGLTSLWNKTKSLGAVIGIGKKEDYAFFNIETGKMNKINISSDGKSTSQCLQYGERINKFVVKCLKYADPVESIYDVKDGGRNLNHYFWKIVWLNSKSGPIGFTQEEGTSNIYATNLATGKKVLLAHRALGFAQFDVEVQNDGKLNMIASNGPFGSETVEDVEAKLETLPAVMNEEVAKN